MQKYAKKTKILGRTFLAIAIASVIFFFFGIILFSHGYESAAALIFMSFATAAAFFITYFVKFFWFGHTLKFLKQNGLENYLDDIDLTAPTFRRSKIYCGENAFFCKTTGSVVAYDQLAWIYSIGGRLGEYTIRFKNGKKAYIMIDDSDELFHLLNDYVSPKSPKIIEGKTVQSQQEFLKLYPKSAPILSKGKIIAGFILASFSFISGIAAFINDTLDGGSLIVIAALGVIGLGLLFFGFKANYIVSKASSIQEWLAHSAIFNTICKVASALAIICLVLIFISGPLKIELIFIPAIIGYAIGMVFLLGSIFLRTGFFVKGMPEYYIDLPKETLNDTSFITDVSTSQNGKFSSYVFRITKGYDWEYICSSVDYLFSSDLDKEHSSIMVLDNGDYTDITKEYLKGIKTGNPPPIWTREHGGVNITGKSKALKNFVSIFLYNQNQYLEFKFSLANEKVATAYIETLIRRSFGTRDQLKLAKPIAPKEPVEFRENGEIHINSQAFIKWLRGNPQQPTFEICSAMPLNEKTPTISLFDDGIKTREYSLQTEGDEDFTGKYFHVSVRLSIFGRPSAPVAQIDGFISNTPEERKMTMNDIGYRMEGYFLLCGGEAGKQRYEMNRGHDLQMKGLKYPGYTTPANVRLIGVCPDCGRSFCFHGYAFYMMQNDVAYSDDGLDCCEIQEYNIDKENWTYETEGKTFRYYNSFNCPHCGNPYIDYKKHPERKVFGVSGCVLLGRKVYRDKI